MVKGVRHFEYDDEGSDSLCNFENKYEFIDIEYDEIMVGASPLECLRKYS